MKRLSSTTIVILFVLSLIGCTSEPAPAEPTVREMILATTTSTYDTGLLDTLIPIFQQKTGYVVKPIAVGTGQALAMAERGEADALLVHDPTSEKKLLEKGVTINRTLVMHNYFAIVGPPDDPAGIKGDKDAAVCLKKIAQAQALFITRGDDSGTHKMERKLWARAGIEPSGQWYHETGQGMGATLMVASEKSGYTLTDRGTFLKLKKSLHLEVMVVGDTLLLNIYSVMQVNPEKLSRVNGPAGKAFVEFMLSPETQAIIKDFGVAEFGEPLFIPDAGKKEEELTG